MAAQQAAGGHGLRATEFPAESLTPEKIDETSPGSRAEFESVVAQARPRVLRGLQIGACVQAWNLAYLRDKTGPRRRVVIHRAETPHLAFQPGKRNFKYVECTFPEFLDSVADGQQVYFRAVSDRSRNSPADFFTDFPQLAADFSIPMPLSVIEERMHSAVLRISGPVAIWLHYDVMANVLFQIRGKKRLLLFPPSDVVRLQVPAGSSSSELDVAEILQLNAAELKGTRPHEVEMGPGDALFIPPLWLHCATPSEGSSVSLNIFWKDLDTGYASGRDAYANRDVQAYEDARKDVGKIVGRFASLPRPMADFYLRRLANELQLKVEHFAEEGRSRETGQTEVPESINAARR